MRLSDAASCFILLLANTDLFTTVFPPSAEPYTMVDLSMGRRAKAARRYP